MAKGKKTGKERRESDSQMGLFDAPRRGKRRPLRKGEARRYRSKAGHTYELVRVD
jgi:hypothetical protein